jgi:hypothetical protein
MGRDTDACALTEKTEAWIQALSFAVDAQSRELLSLQLQFTILDDEEPVAYAVLQDPATGGYLVYRSISAPALFPLIADDARVQVKDVFTVIDRLGLDLSPRPTATAGTCICA